jgi:YVTN family beta-propeller protein
MLPLLYVLLATARSSLNSRRELALENLALRQQLAIVQRKTKRPKLSNADRAFWVALCGLWPDWHNALLIVKPETREIVYRIATGIDPVSVAVRPDGLEVWVSNHVSDSVTVIDVDPSSRTRYRVVGTIQAWDEAG